jgi:hypothetical protein
MKCSTDGQILVDNMLAPTKVIINTDADPVFELPDEFAVKC